MSSYNAEKIEFPNSDQSRLVESELKIIKALREKTNLSDPYEARKLLNQCKAKQIFKTRTGLNFLDSLEQTANINTKNEQTYKVYSENNGSQKKNNIAFKIIVIALLMIAIAAVAVLGLKIKNQIAADNLNKIIGIWEYSSKNTETKESLTTGFEINDKYEFNNDGSCRHNSTSYVYLENKISGYNDETKIEISSGMYTINGNKIIFNFDSRVSSKVKVENGDETHKEARELKRNISYTYLLNGDRLILIDSDGNENAYHKIQIN